MIVRTWHGRTTLSDADAYEAFMVERAAQDYGSVKGLKQLFLPAGMRAILHIFC